MGVAIGLLAALWLLMSATATGAPPALVRRTSPGRTLARIVLGPGASTRMLILAGDWVVWAYLGATAALAAAIYTGTFDLATRGVTEDLSGWLRWAPTGLITVLGALFGGAARKRLSLGEFKGHGNAQALVETVHSRSLPFLDLVRARVDRDVRRRMLEIAAGYEVGLIQRTMWNVSDDALDRGKLSPEKRQEIMDGLFEVRPGVEGRDTLLNRLAAVEHSTRLIALEELEGLLRESDRRARADRRQSSARPASEDRRTADDRRVRSPWRPAPKLQPQVAA